MGRPKKAVDDKFSELDVEWRNKMVSSSPEEIDQKIADLTKIEQANLKLMKEDEDLNAAKDHVKELSADYKADSKKFKLEIQFMMEVLKSEGKAV